MSLDNNQLCNRIKEKDPDALEELYADTEPALYAFIYRMTKNKQDTEEMMKKLFQRLWREAPGIQDQTMRQWLFTHARLMTFKRLKQRVSAVS
ncbi:RNA polymerase sigma factor [Alkalicoccobacillus porphyridii]|uniref:RNA polymerase sigma-70 region 2 domain-containing protein n=1 Tax=Alkalicoccobacillus porphyridii TaxID=2597270 RepID=A0A553ZUJ6_9BACI|nr:sigma factor [Alkalicoccobacillus porphyridii]TSB45129.1 hypothetical protein FN960_17775 [Alkalicoccobacillus porphyridii]